MFIFDRVSKNITNTSLQLQKGTTAKRLTSILGLPCTTIVSDALLCGVVLVDKVCRSSANQPLSPRERAVTPATNRLVETTRPDKLKILK